MSLPEAVGKGDKALGGEIWAGVVDVMGGDILETAVKNTKHRGMITCCGNIRSGELRSSIYPFILRGVSLSGIDSATCPMEERIIVWGKLANEWKPDHLGEIVESLNGLEELDAQIERMLKGDRTGRSVIHLP